MGSMVSDEIVETRGQRLGLGNHHVVSRIHHDHPRRADVLNHRVLQFGRNALVPQQFDVRRGDPMAQPGQAVGGLQGLPGFGHEPIEHEPGLLGIHVVAKHRGRDFVRHRHGRGVVEVLPGKEFNVGRQAFQDRAPFLGNGAGDKDQVGEEFGDFLGYARHRDSGEGVPYEDRRRLLGSSDFVDDGVDPIVQRHGLERGWTAPASREIHGPGGDLEVGKDAFPAPGAVGAPV